MLQQCQTASYIVLYFTIYSSYSTFTIISDHASSYRMILSISVDVFIYTSLYMTVFIATERNSTGIYQHSTRILQITPLSSVSAHDLHVSRWVPRKQRNVTLKRSIRRDVLLNPPRFGWSLSWFGIQVCDLHVVSGFRHVTFQTFFFWILTCFSLHLSNKHLVTNCIVSKFPIIQFRSILLLQTNPPTFLETKTPTGKPPPLLGLFRGFFGCCFICCGPMAHLRLFASSHLTEICGWWSSVRRRCRGGSRGRLGVWRDFLWLTKISKIPGLQKHGIQFPCIFVKGELSYVEFLGTVETSNHFLEFSTPDPLGRWIPIWREYFSKWGGEKPPSSTWIWRWLLGFFA